MNRTLLLLSLFATSCTVTTRNTPPPREPPPDRPMPPPDRPMPPPDRPMPPPERPTPPPFSWDNKGWTMVGERSVDGKLDFDKIDIDTRAGHIYRLTVVVLDSDLELVEMKLNFKSGKSYPTDFKNVVFREDQRTRMVPIPSDELTRVDFKYKNLAGGGKARIQLWADYAAPAVEKAAWDTTGWSMYGEKLVDSATPKDFNVVVDPKKATIGQLTFGALDSDVEIVEIKLSFKSGKSFVTEIKNELVKRGTQTRVIKLPSEKLTRIDYKLKNVPGATVRGRLQAWGRP